MSTKTALPGKLGDPAQTLGADPRADLRLVAALTAIGMAGASEPLALSDQSSIEEIRAFTTMIEPGFEAVLDSLYTDLSPVDGVTSRTEVISGVDGNDIKLYIHEPSAPASAASGAARPCVLHLHGGGMVILQASGASYRRWRDELAALGLVVVGVEFRNAGGELGHHPFPAGLNDCTSALQWVDANKAQLGVSKVVVSGESGGGNLTLATTIKASREGRLEMIDGVYAQCPYISGAYAAPPPELASLQENDDYFLSNEMMTHFVRAYDPSGENLKNPLAWPLNASIDDLEGLPPHVISVNELDPLRDEGLAYYHKLVQAGVAVNSRTVNGTCHAADVIFRAAIPEAYAASAHDLKTFAYNC